MDKKEMVEILRKVLKEFDTKNQGYTLVMLISEESYANNTLNWNVLISAKWLDNQNLKKSLTKFIDILKKNGSENILKSISKISILRTSDTFVSSMNSFYSVSPKNIMDLPNISLHGVTIDKAVILESKKAA